MNKLKKKIIERKAKIAVLGLGYVGMPLASAFYGVGFEVLGLDIRKLDLPLKPKFTISNDFSLIKTCDIAIICVPTPLGNTKDPDTTAIEEAARSIVKFMPKEMLVVLESTSYPGTTRDLILPILGQKGVVGKDFYLAFSPERIDPGNAFHTLTSTPKIVSGITESCLDLASYLYVTIVTNVVRVSSTETAEMAKLLENTFRCVNIALANEFALISEKLRVNVWEVIDAAATKPFGFMPFYPGPGLGGHCIPVDPHYLSWKMKTLGMPVRFIELADRINSFMPLHVVHKIQSILNKHGKALKGSKIVLLGVAYKPNVPDFRGSPTLEVEKLLVGEGSIVSLVDPFKRPFNPIKALEHSDLSVIMTAHSAFDPKTIISRSKIVLDTRNLTNGYHADNVVKL